VALSALSTGTLPATRDSRDRSPQGHYPLRYWLSSALATLLVVATVAGLFIPGLYRDTPDWVAQTQATDLVTLAVAVPVLVMSLVLATRGSLRAEVIWLGALGYILYMYVIYAFDVAFNPLFPVYVAALSLSIWSLAALLMHVDLAVVRAHCRERLPVRAIALYLLIVAALFFMAWMKDIVPAVIGNSTPASLEKTRQLTNPVEVLDLSILLPLCVLSGVLLWQHRPWGYLLAGVALTTMTIIGLSIVVDMVFEHHTDPMLSLGMVPLFAAVTLIGLGLLAIYLRNLRLDCRLGSH